ncbi:MAG: DUF4345 domain-containing protein [Pseudomonadota bacterium]|nr:DUF4345 domain-containing protein [Pseudomonadota bacterium]
MNGYLLVTGVLFLLVGLRALLKPVEAVAMLYALEANTVDAKNYLRSGAGGVAISSGLTMIIAVFVPQLAFAALVVAIVILGGLVFGRLVSLLLDGNPSIVPWIAGIIELLGLASGTYWLANFPI